MTSTLTYDIAQREGDDVAVTVFHGTESYIATPEHPNFDQIVARLRSGDEGVVDLFDVSIGIASQMSHLSERVTAGAGHLYLDGDKLAGELADTIIRFLAEGNSDYAPLVNFLEKVILNPNEHSRENLYRWLRQESFGICPDGDFIAYKGVANPNGNGHYVSISSGTAWVNGVRYDGPIPTEIGNVVEMPRSAVAFDPGVGCSTGLHAGTWSYASNFARGAVLRVKINPRDVVSVPTDSDDAKVRVCRYYIESVASRGQDTALLYLPDPAKLARPVQRPATEAPVVDPATAKAPPRKRSAPRGGSPAKARLAPKPLEFPKHYEDFAKKHFDGCQVSELRWLAKEWGIRPTAANKAGYVDALTKAARKRRREIDGK